MCIVDTIRRNPERMGFDLVDEAGYARSDANPDKCAPVLSILAMKMAEFN